MLPKTNKVNVESTMCSVSVSISLTRKMEKEKKKEPAIQIKRWLDNWKVSNTKSFDLILVTWMNEIVIDSDTLREIKTNHETENIEPRGVKINNKFVIFKCSSNWVVFILVKS